jgi:putative effector of murein hydrolase LrgA (UPF0299 family)
MPRIIGLLVLVLVILTLVNLWKSDKDTEKKLLWTAAILFVPLIVAIVYLLLQQKQK